MSIGVTVFGRFVDISRTERVIYIPVICTIDANNMTNENISPEHAYKFARGEEVIAQKGLPVKLGRPLDFLVIADHGEYLGFRWPSCGQFTRRQ